MPKTLCRLSMLLYLGLMPLVSLGLSLNSATGSANNTRFYYQIGGATSIMAPANVNATTAPLTGSFQLGLGYSCGKFDPVVGLKSAINQAADIGTLITHALQGMIAALPMLILQRVNPGLYDLVQNMIIKGEAMVALANTSCEQMEREIKKGNNPYEVWTDLSKMYDWKLQMGQGNEAVTVAKSNVEANNGSSGVPWVGGNNAGGFNQTPLRLTSDIVKAGYNLNLNRSVTDTASYTPPNGQNPRLGQIWASPADAAAWATAVLGDVHIATYDTHPQNSRPGMGLLPSIQLDQTGLELRLKKLVNKTVTPDLTNLKDVSSNELLITQDVIQSIQELSPTEQAIAMSKLASEVAMSNSIEKAMLVRRMLLTGKREPNVIKTAAINHIDANIAELDKEIDNVLFEKRVHHDLASNTAGLLLDLAAQHQNRGKVQQQEPLHDLKPIIDSATKP